MLVKEFNVLKRSQTSEVKMRKEDLSFNFGIRKCVF